METLNTDRTRHDHSAVGVIAQQYSSSTFISILFRYSKKKEEEEEEEEDDDDDDDDGDDDVKKLKKM